MAELAPDTEEQALRNEIEQFDRRARRPLGMLGGMLALTAAVLAHRDTFALTNNRDVISEHINNLATDPNYSFRRRGGGGTRCPSNKRPARRKMAAESRRKNRRRK
jgi:N-methylhydantoinase B/oxoprolinase/acetone carboxylase alpha subunit